MAKQLLFGERGGGVSKVELRAYTSASQQTVTRSSTFSVSVELTSGSHALLIVIVAGGAAKTSGKYGAGTSTPSMGLVFSNVTISGGTIEIKDGLAFVNVPSDGTYTISGSHNGWGNNSDYTQGVCVFEIT